MKQLLVVRKPHRCHFFYLNVSFYLLDTKSCNFSMPSLWIILFIGVSHSSTKLETVIFHFSTYYLTLASWLVTWTAYSASVSINNHNRDGVMASGLYIAVANLIEMITTEQEVDVFQVEHDIRRTRPQFIDSQVIFFTRISRPIAKCL